MSKVSLCLEAHNILFLSFQTPYKPLTCMLRSLEILAGGQNCMFPRFIEVQKRCRAKSCWSVQLLYSIATCSHPSTSPSSTWGRQTLLKRFQMRVLPQDWQDSCQFLHNRRAHMKLLRHHQASLIKPHQSNSIEWNAVQIFRSKRRSSLAVTNPIKCCLCEIDITSYLVSCYLVKEDGDVQVQGNMQVFTRQIS